MQKDIKPWEGDRWSKGAKFHPQAQIKEEAYIINNPFTSKGDIITWVWALPLATAKLGGDAPVSYHHHTPIFTVFLSSILLVVSWFSRIKFWHDLVLSFALWSLYVIESVSYIIKISVESRAWLFCYDLEWIKEKRKRIKRNKEIILILLRVMTSHRKSMMIKNCWELTSIALVIVAINRK